MIHGRILDRYIQREVLAPFFLSIITLTFVLFLQRMFRLAELVVSKSATLLSTAKLILYILPGFLVVTVPISLLVGALTAFSRLSADAEVTAMKASRISLYGMIRPVMQLAFLLFILTAFIVHFLAPDANYALKTHLFNMVKAQAMVGLEQGVFSSTFDGMVVYVERIDSLDDMGGIFISDERTASEPYAIMAKQGRLITNPDTLNVTLAMEKGSIHLQPREEHSYTVMSFETGLLNLDINQALLKRSGAAGRDVDGTDSLALLTTLKQARRSGQPAKAAEMEIHKRFSASYACLLFGLVGAPLGIRRSRSGKSAGIAVAIGVTLVYYLILAAGTNLAEKGTLSPAAAYWLPNGLVTLAALLLVVKKGREVSFGVVDRLIVFSRRLLSRRRGPA